jgi:hypothetical protein
VKRRVGLNLASQERKVGHFNVVSSPLSQKKPPLDINLDGRALADDRIGASTAREYLRVYYSDFLGAAPAKGPTLADVEGKTVECDEWVRWMQEANPRTRVDAYPLLLVCKVSASS